jgi:hypothetical protein
MPNLCTAVPRNAHLRTVRVLLACLPLSLSCYLSGTVCIGTFGLRGSVNYDNAAAAVDAADLIVTRLRALGNITCCCVAVWVQRTTQLFWKRAFYGIRLWFVVVGFTAVAL